jgi:hypothetical protein
MQTSSETANRLMEISKMGRSQLLELWRKLFVTPPPPAARRDLLVRFVVYKFQERAYGGLSLETKKRLLELARRIAKDSKANLIGTSRIKPGTCLIRDWRGRSHRVLVLGEGYEYAGKKYASLSQIARLITGTRWSGPLFFGLKTNSPKEDPRE